MKVSEIINYMNKGVFTIPSLTVSKGDLFHYSYMKNLYEAGTVQELAMEPEI